METQQHTWKNLIWQPLIAVLFITTVLFFMGHFAHNDVLWAVGAGSLSSSCYIVFGNPSGKAAHPIKIFGGYLVGIATGLLLRFAVMYIYPESHSLFTISQPAMTGIAAAISIGLCLFFMSILKVQHPPAAGMALVLVIDMHDYDEILLIFLAAIVLMLLKILLKKRLVDLA